MVLRSIRLWFPFLAQVLSLAVTSCVYDREDCPENLSLDIVSDWQLAPDASPGGMAYIFFPYDGSVPWRFDFIGNLAGKVTLPVGTYSFLSYNDDTASVIFSEDSGYDGYEATTADADSPDASCHGERSGDRVLRTPDMLWGCAYGYVDLWYDGLRHTVLGTDKSDSGSVFSPGFILTALQRPLTAHYTFRIEDVRNLSGVRSMSATLSGMAGSLSLASGVKGRYPSTLLLKVKGLDSETVGGDFYTFGIPSEPDAPNILSLYVVIKDGRRFCYKFDVSPQVRNAPDPMEVTLILRGLTIEPPSEGDETGFDITVDGWETVIVNIKD